MKLVYIHGANATSSSFNYIREHLNYSNELLIEYNVRDGFENNLAHMKNALRGQKDMFFICHSLGGVFAVNLADTFSKNTLGAVTIATPYGGSTSADFIKYFLPFNRLLKDISTNGLPITSTNKIAIKHPWVNVVSTRGDSPWISEPNDGVVTVASMKHRKDMDYVEMAYNHYEVVISPSTVSLIKARTGL